MLQDLIIYFKSHLMSGTDGRDVRRNACAPTNHPFKAQISKFWYFDLFSVLDLISISTSVLLGIYKYKNGN